MSSVDQGRRQILAWGAAMAGVTLAPGVTLFDLAHGRAPTEPASSKVRWGMLVDLNQCASDCDACVSACDKENGLPAEKTATSAQSGRPAATGRRSSGWSSVSPGPTAASSCARRMRTR